MTGSSKKDGLPPELPYRVIPLAALGPIQFIFQKICFGRTPLQTLAEAKEVWIEKVKNLN
jgi:hypothetical protein